MLPEGKGEGCQISSLEMITDMNNERRRQFKESWLDPSAMTSASSACYQEVTACREITPIKSKCSSNLKAPSMNNSQLELLRLPVKLWTFETNQPTKRRMRTSNWKAPSINDRTNSQWKLLHLLKDYSLRSTLRCSRRCLRRAVLRTGSVNKD